jgi:hypothetical protein
MAAAFMFVWVTRLRLWITLVLVIHALGWSALAAQLTLRLMDDRPSTLTTVAAEFGCHFAFMISALAFWTSHRKQGAAPAPAVS